MKFSDLNSEQYQALLKVAFDAGGNWSPDIEVLRVLEALGLIWRFAESPEEVDSYMLSDWAQEPLERYEIDCDFDYEFTALTGNRGVQKLRLIDTTGELKPEEVAVVIDWNQYGRRKDLSNARTAGIMKAGPVKLESEISYFEKDGRTYVRAEYPADMHGQIAEQIRVQLDYWKDNP